MAGRPLDLYQVLDRGSVVGTNYGDYWIITWLPKTDTHNGWILDSRDKGFPIDRGPDGIIEWVLQQDWAR